METFTPAPESDEPLIGIRELAAWLDVSEHTVKRWTAAGPASGLVPRMLRVNGQLRFRRQDVRTWLDSKEVR
jgi:predicted DNA-binding transcriptional regulator AlpA